LTLFYLNITATSRDYATPT